jgi:hypothetical protein
MLSLPPLPVRGPDIPNQRSLAAPFLQRNAQIDHSLRPRKLTPVPKTHLLVGFVLLKNDI